ncbi:MAG: hypothetical protein ACR2NZ_02635 [Rubripirellula sp.]
MGSGDSAEQSTAKPAKGSSRRRWWALLLFVVGFLCLPQIVARTSLRDQVLAAIVGDSDLSVTSKGASFGWLSPLTIDRFELRSREGDVTITIARLESKRSWVSLWVGQQNLGEIRIESPRVELVLDHAASQETLQLDELPELTAVIRDGSLLVRDSTQSEPVIDVSKIDLTLHIEKEEGKPIAVVDAITLAERETLSVDACEHGLQLVAPVLVEEVKLSGEYTLDIATARLPLDGVDPERRAVVEGKVILHRVDAEFTNDVTRRVILVMTDLMEIEDVPETIRLIDDATISFRLADERVHHEASADVFPNLVPGISVLTKGDVGLDESLNVEVSVKIPFDTGNETPLAKELSQVPIVVTVGGVADNLLIEIPNDQRFVQELESKLQSPEISPDEKQLGRGILDAIGELEGIGG